MPLCLGCMQSMPVPGPPHADTENKSRDRLAMFFLCMRGRRRLLLVQSHSRCFSAFGTSSHPHTEPGWNGIYPVIQSSQLLIYGAAVFSFFFLFQINWEKLMCSQRAWNHPSVYLIAHIKIMQPSTKLCVNPKYMWSAIRSVNELPVAQPVLLAIQTSL